jgi:hypothetical protein
MKTTTLLISTILAVGFLLFIQVNSSAQTCGLPPTETTITTASGASLDVTYQFDLPNYAYASFVGDGYCLKISWWPGSPSGITVKINNSDSDWDRGPGIISLDNGFGGMESNANDEVVDLSAMPPDYRELWEQCIGVSGDLIESDEFTEILNTADKDIIDEVLETLEKIRDGYVAPSAFNQFFTMQFYTGGWVADFRPGRGFYIEGPMDFRLATPDPFGTLNPEIYIDTELGSDDSWAFYIDPNAEIIEVSSYGGFGISEEETAVLDYGPALERLLSAINFNLDQNRALIDAGVISEEDELGFLLGKALEGLNTYPVEVVTAEEMVD